MIMLAMSTKDIFDDGGHEEGGGDEGCSKHHESQGSTGDVIRLSDVVRFLDVIRFSDVIRFLDVKIMGQKGLQIFDKRMTPFTPPETFLRYDANIRSTPGD